MKNSFPKSARCCMKYSYICARPPMLEEESRLAALRAALDEGEASPDVEDFDPERFLQELKAKHEANG